MGLPRQFARWRHLLPLAVGFALLSAVVALAVSLSVRLDEETASARRTLETKSALERLLTLLQDAETGQRGFLLTGDEAYLEPYRGRGLIPAQIDALTDSDMGDRRSAAIAELRRLTGLKLAELATTIERRRSGDAEGALAMVRGGVGKLYFDRLRVMIAEMEAEEDRAFLARQARAATVRSALQAGTLGIVILIAGLAIGTISQLDRRARRLAAAEASARESEARYRLLAETGSDMIARADLTGARRYVSPASLALLGYAPEELIDTRPEDMTHPEDAGSLTATLQGLREGKVERAASTHRLRRKDGGHVWVEARYWLLRDPETGAALETVSAVRDVSERQRQTEELRDAKEKAEAADRAKGDFLASMSHELRTPLNGIIGFSGLMLEADLRSDETRRHARLVHEASRTLLAIVDDVLDVSKLEAGALELDPRPFSPRALVENTAELLRGQAEAKGLAYRVEIAPDCPALLLGDDGRLRQVLLNLISNAVKFTARGAITVSVDLLGWREGAAVLKMSVRDTGIGIPRDKRHRLFRRFSQIDSSTARRFGGTGLGLSICKSLVEIMGGTILVESEEGRGSRFGFEVALPLAKAPAEEAAPREGAGAAAGLTILVAEDVPMNQELVVALLTRWGHAVDVASDGAGAVDAVGRRAYDLILMDVQMPVMDGVEATRRIRAMGGRFAALPILAMTANVLPDDIARFVAEGMSGHVGKPFEPERLRAAIARWAPAAPAPAEGPLDHDAIETLRAMVGEDGLRSLAARFVIELEGRLNAEPDGPAGRRALAGDAHALVSSAGMLGFLPLSDAARALEQACLVEPPAAGGLAAALAQARAEKARAAAAARALAAAPPRALSA